MKKKMLSVEKCLEVVEEAGAPVVIMAGGEPLIHPQINEIIAGIIQQKRFVYTCSNGLLMERAMQTLKPSKYFCWVVHLDGMEASHDYWVDRKGTWNIAIEAVKQALTEGYRVCTNTTVFKDSNIADLHELFRYLTDLGVEGMMVSAGYPYMSVGEQDMFLQREESIRTFKQVLDVTKYFNFYNNPLYLSFLRGERHYDCRAWTNPTYTPLGWRKPCYLLADEHTDSLAELMDESLWEQYGTGKDPRCASCMMHCGYEAGIVEDALTNPGEFGALVKGYLKQGMGNGGKSGRSAGEPERQPNVAAPSLAPRQEPDASYSER